jgi:hypothetical protein
VHDLTHYELRGLPSVMIASTEFVHAAQRQAEALGMPEVAERAVYVPHPIQDATDEEMRAKARAALDAILAALTDPDGGKAA